jgi:hypothetical protein
MRTNFRLWPYGVYLNRGFVYFFDRDYQPIAGSPWFDYNPFTGGLRFSRTLAPIAPETRINFETQWWFYNDATSPTRDRKTRAELRKMITSIPDLTAEIARRSGVRA